MDDGWFRIDDPENPPPEFPHLRGMWVYSSQTGKPLYWTADAGYIDGDGEFCYTCGDVTGWSADAYTHWARIPPPPVTP
jgi:hypothetical protein